MWDVRDANIYYTFILMLIDSGCRIGELLDLKKENLNLEERYFKIIASKTEAGIRTAPIAEKVYPFFEYWYHRNDCEYLLSTPEGEHFKYRNYYDSYWMPLITTLNMTHRPHDTRHTCISMLTVAGVSDKVIKKIVGHKGQGARRLFIHTLRLRSYWTQSAKYSKRQVQSCLFLYPHHVSHRLTLSHKRFYP